MNEQLLNLLTEERYQELRAYLNDLPVEELSSFMKEYPSYAILLFREMPEEKVVPVFIGLPVDLQETVLDGFSHNDIQSVTEQLFEDDAAELLKGLDQKIVNKLLMETDPDTRNEKILEIMDVLEQRNFVKLRPLLNEMMPQDLAELLSEANEEDLLIAFRLLPKELAAETFVEMDSDLQEELIKAFNDKELTGILDELFVDDLVDIVEEMPANVIKRILAKADPDTRIKINELLKYPKNSAGAIMTTECVSLRKHMTVEESFRKIRKQALDKETVYTLYVTDEQKTLLGIVTVKDLLLHDYKDKVGDFMEDNYVSVSTLTDREEVALLFDKYNLLAIPVVDQEDRLVGIITVDDAIDVMTEEATEDIIKMAAVTPSSRPYLSTSVWRIWLSRVPWLLILMVSATFTGMIITTYESTLAVSITLTACIPMLMDSGGNAGSQASVTIIRSIALNEVQFRDLFKILWKEMRVSILLGLTLSVACFAKLMAVDQLFRIANGYWIAVVVCVAMFITIVIAKVVGCTLPLLAKKFRLDPAVVASPFITTIVDALSLIIYCNIAILILRPLGVM